ncbi:recombinase family protein [Mycolicibacterium sp. PDY-3]|uniref:recombinase family protein n=1 Tax=Mycolicibacterium sp. PDY-3 TaxID=3376069 RepID=UPI003790412B
MRDRDSQSTNTFAAIYCRISSDKTGAGLGVERQEGDCRELADKLGLKVKHVLVDNDISAYSGKRRPGYEELLQLIESQEIGYVVSWHTDRLHRRLRDLLDYLDAVEQNGTKTVTVKAGDIDLSTAQGITMAQVSGAIAEGYVRSNTEKLQRAKLQMAQAGKFMGGQRPYGFEPQRAAIREPEAAIIREMAGRVVEGESFNSIAVDLYKRGIRTQHGKVWKAANIYNVLRRPINAGIVYHKGVETKAQSPAVFTADQWNELKGAMQYRAATRPHRTRFRKHVLNGLLYCAKCGGKLTHKSKQQRDGSYKPQVTCSSSDGVTGQRTGCGGVTRLVDPIIDLVSDATIYRLDSAQLARRLKARKKGKEDSLELFERQRRLEARLNELNDDYYVNGSLNRQEFERLKLSANSELEDVRRDIERLARSTVLPNIVLSGDIRARWAEASLEWRRDLLLQLIERIIVHPKPPIKGYYPPVYKHWRFDPDLIEIRWRF